MKHFLAIGILLLLPLMAVAVEDGQVLYAGGTVSTIKEGVIGKLNTSSETALVFEYPGGSGLVIPFGRIDSYEYKQEAARHLGVLPAIGVGLVKKRQKKHFFRISYRDEKDTAQVAVFEVPKHMPKSLLAVLQTRAPEGCKTPKTKCVVEN